MTVDLALKVEELLAENRKLRQDLEARSVVAARAMASFQQRALLMEITRQQNEDLDRLAAELSRAKKLEEERAREIESSARLKSEFLANFSHEIRTPLNGILGYCDLLLREEGTRLTPHGRRDLTIIKTNARTLLALINDILDLSKIEAGRAEVVKETFDVGEIVDECMATVRDYLKGKDVQLGANVAPECANAFSDPLKIRQVLLNLLSNAAKFTDAGEIVVSIEPAGDSMVMAVEDTGAGIPSDQLPLIFEKFRQVDGSATRRVGGTGLGLAIVREVTTLLGGSVSVTSTLGRGSRFVVTLPGALERRQRPASSPIADAALRGVATKERPDGAASESQAPAPPDACTVLVIDDDPLVQHLVRGQLEESGFRVVSASDGVEGLTVARELRPTIIILDLHLPRLDGWQVLAELKTDPALVNIPVVIMSVEEQRARGFSFGACEYLVKPVEPDRLVTVVRRAIAPGGGDVLVVDDDDDTRELVSRSLRRAGFTTVEARTGEEALLRARVVAPAMVILDLLMPGIDGFEVLRALRAEGHSIPIVVLTGKTLTQAEKDVLTNGMTRIVTKGGVAIDQVLQQAKQLLIAKRVVETSRLPRVLYVEDSPQNRDLVRRYVADVFELLEAEDGEHGLERAAREVPDLILMDLSLPRLDGWEATRRLKANPALRHIPVVALTAHAGREDQARARAAGCNDYLTKPIERDVLLAMLRKHLAHRPAAGVQQPEAGS
jgi:CheY-like chemotaxis protein/signal transduction histidine kinase